MNEVWRSFAAKIVWLLNAGLSLSDKVVIIDVLSLQAHKIYITQRFIHVSLW